MNDFPTLSNFDPKDYVFEDRYPKRNRKNKIPVENLSSLEEPDYINKAEKLTCLPYKIETILASQDFEHDEFITKIPIEEFSLEYIRRTGLSTPLFFNVPPDHLGMRMPDPEKFTVDDVLECVGGERKIEVVEVYTQNGRLMKLREFIDYYKGPAECRPDLLNVLSLEFSSTKLAELVSAPAFVSQIDWIDNVWPKELYARQADLLRKSTWAEENDFSTYPKVQRYCLMSVANCFTDFHIDFGGTSVWYHILKGEKVFWLIEPTEENLKLYEEWILGGSNNSSFFGNVVNKCARIHLVAGNTLVIPSGWIHCVYTPCDSLVFGGNFLHNYAVPMQIRISKSEDRIRIGNKYRFPHFKQIFWCYIAKVLREATGRVYQRKPPTIAHVKNSAYARKTKKSSLSSTPEGGEPSASEQPEKEELPHLQPADVQMMASDGANVVPESDGEDVGIGLKFFDDFGNAEDGSFTFNPIQLKFGDVDEANFVAATDYNEEYIRSLSSFEINGFHSLLSFANRLIKKQPEVVEGITRPSNLITELEAFLKHLAEAGLLNLQMDLDLSPKMPLVQGFVEWSIDTLPKETTEVFVKLPPKRKQNKRRSAESASFSSTKKPTKQEPILVDGLPLATHGFDHNNGHNNGFDPIAQVVKLGHNPIASAWRRFGTTSDVLQPPSMDFPSVEKKPDTSSNLAEEFSIAESAKPPSPDLNSNESPTLDETVEEKKPIAKKKFRIPRGPPKIVEKHDDSPEFTHRSPLQRFFTQKPAANVSNPASRTFAEPSVSKPYNHNQQQTGYHRDRDSRDRNGEGGWRSEYGNRRDSYQRSQDPVENRPRSFSSNSNNNHNDGNRSNQYNNNNSNNGFSNNGFDNSGFDRWRGGNNNGNGDGQFDSFSGGGFSADRPSKSMDDSSQYDYENSTSTVNRNISTAEAEQRRSPAEVAYGYGNPQQQQDRAVRPQSQSKHSDSVKHEMEEMPAQPMSTTVNELHHLSQIMDCPNYVDIDQIPLPPSPAKPAQNAAEGREFEEEQHRRPADPFNEVDELASLGQLMC